MSQIKLLLLFYGEEAFIPDYILIQHHVVVRGLPISLILPFTVNSPEMRNYLHELD